MNVTVAGLEGLRTILQRKEAELVQAGKRRDDIVLERSPDQMDEIQDASQRDLTIQNAERGSSLLRDVEAALQRIHDNSFGSCIECGRAISPKRLVAVPWASRCIQCQEVEDRSGEERTPSLSESLVNAA